MDKRVLYLGLDPTHYICSAIITHWPIIQIMPVPITDSTIRKTLNQFSSYSHVIMTSKTAVYILRDYLQKLGIDLDVWKKKKTIAVGRVTAYHLEQLGIFPSIIASDETAEGIVEELKKLDLKECHLFWPHSAKSRTVISDYLEEQKIIYSACIFYAPKNQENKNVPNLNDFDEIIFTSPSTVEAFFEIFGHVPQHIKLTAVGPITEKALSQAMIIDL